MRVAIVNVGGSREEVLRALLTEEPEISFVGEFALSEGLLPRHQDGIDVVFLSLQGSSIDQPFAALCEILPFTLFRIIVAPDDRWALRAIQLHVLDYLVAPVGRDRIREALQWSEIQMRQQRAAEQVPVARGPDGGNKQAERRRDRLMVKSHGRIVLLKVCDINWIEAEGGYVRLYCTEKKYMLRGKIGDIEHSLPTETFVRIHRSAMVNMERIKEIEQLPHGEYAVVLQDGTRHPLSRSFRERVFCQFVDISKVAV